LPPTILPFDDGVLDEEDESVLCSVAETLVTDTPADEGPVVQRATPAGGFSLNVQDLAFTRTLAEGAYGVVWEGGLRGRDGPLAIKIQRVPLDEQEQANLLTELSVLQGLSHPRLVHYEGSALLEPAEAEARPEWTALLVGPQQEEGGEARRDRVESMEKVRSPRSPRMTYMRPQAPPKEAMLVLTAMELCENGELGQAGLSTPCDSLA
jgi:serine/threonine protein kinase